jgi:Na+/proline symporter
VVSVLQTFVFQQWGVPFYVTVLVFICLILLYTFEGGIKTIIWTDTLQTTFMLLGVGLSVYIISKELGYSFGDLVSTIKKSDYSQIIFTDVNDKRFFLKQFFSGMFITITMTGLDQEMMQKNLSCKSLKDAQKNMISFSLVLVFINLLFLSLGVILYQYAQQKGIALPSNSDELFPTLAIKYLGSFAGLVFIIGLISAAYPSADGALTSLTTSFCVDILGLNKREDLDEQKRKRIRYYVHFSFAFLLFLVIVLFKSINDQAVVGKLFTVAGYTYGPLLGLFAYGLFTKNSVKDKWVPVICILSPIICYILNANSVQWLNGYKFGFELLILNGIITFIGLLLLRKNK